VDRRRFFKQLLVGTAGLGTLATLDGVLIEPHLLVVEHVNIRLPRLPEAFHGFRVVQLSDFHFGPYIGAAQVQRAVRLARSLNPGLVLLTGDFVSHPLFQPNGPAGARHAEPCAQILQELRGVPTFAILGNHDYWNDANIVAEILESHGIPVLRNRSIPLERDGKRLWIVGVDDVFERANDLEKALAGIPIDDTKIAAVHEPDFAVEVARHSVDLQLSGHSHGGQVWIPGIGAPILPRLAHRYPRGLYQVRKLQLYTNRGIGMVTPPVRLNCPPEVTVITLVA
jgi:predicted MPP superfamily phosphohydrolase